jgi:hypothetical protein
MKFTAPQLEQFDRDGLLVLSEHILAGGDRGTDRRDATPVRAAPAGERSRVGQRRRAYQLRHMYSAPFARLARHPRMVMPVAQIFGEPSTCISSRSTARWPSTATRSDSARGDVGGVAQAAGHPCRVAHAASGQSASLIAAHAASCTAPHGVAAAPKLPRWLAGDVRTSPARLRPRDS